MIIDLNKLKNIHFYTKPYRWAQKEDLIVSPIAQRLLQEFPSLGFEHCESNRQDKTYNMYSRNLFSFDSDKANDDLTPLWKQLIVQLKGETYKKKLAKAADLLLDDCLLEIKLWNYRNGCWLSPHVDKVDKIITQLIYFNDHWEEKWGGALRILNSSTEADCHSEIFPGQANSVILLRSENSWHSVTRQKTAEEVNRRVLQITYWKT